MHCGFYEEPDSLLKDFEEPDWFFLENIGGEYEVYANNMCSDGINRNFQISAYDFLHGCCNEFAYMLNEKYGYPVFEIKGEEGNLIHSFARVDTDSKHYFIDVRGITTDYSEFISEFEDWTDEETSIENTFPVDLQNEGERERNTPSKENREFIEKLFSDYGDYYSSLSQCMKEQNNEIER